MGNDKFIVPELSNIISRYWYHGPRGKAELADKILDLIKIKPALAKERLPFPEMKRRSLNAVQFWFDV